MGRGLFAAVFAAVAMFALWHPARVAIQALLLLPALFPAAPFEPLTLLTAAPLHEQAEYSYSGGTIDTDVFAPASAGRHGAIVLLLGAGDLPRNSLAIHLADALARLGIVTVLPESSGMLSERLRTDEIDAIRVTIDALDARPDVDRSRVGIVGLSAAGGLAVVAAAQPDLRDQIQFVNSFGSYEDTTRLLIDVASRSQVIEGDVHDWQPESRTLEVVANALQDAGVSDEDRAELLSGVTRERADEIIRNFSSAVRQRLDGVSPSGVLGSVKAHLYLMHDLDDPFIPVTESRHLVADAKPGQVFRYTEFSIFAHVIPDRPVEWRTFVPDLWRLFWHLHAVLLEVG